MMNQADYPSDEETSDDEYVPSDGEKVSEEENSGVDEDFVADDGEDVSKQGRGKRKLMKKKDTSRKRKGGIKLEGEEEKSENAEKEDEYSTKLAEQVKEEETQKKEREEKKKTDSLWADFMKDVGGPKPKSKPSGGGLGNIASLSTLKATNASTSSPSSQPTSKPAAAKKVTVTKVFDFAGETVKVSKEVDADSKEAKAAEQEKEEKEEVKKPTAGPAIPGFKRTGGGLGSVLGKIGKAPKMSVLDKSKLDWNSFKKDEGIEEELQIHNRGKEGYIERKQFLERTDLRQFEIEKGLRQKNKHV